MAEENEIIQLSMRFRSALIRQDEAALSRLVDTYQRLYSRLQDKIDKLVDVIALEEPTAAQLAKMVRYRQLMAQIQDELGGYQNYVKAELEQIGAAGVEAGLKDARQMVQFVADGYGIQAGFNNLPKDAIETMLGFLQEDGPLYKRLSELAPTTTNNIADALLEGIGLGYGPRKTARDIIRQQLGLALTDALRMARTTQLWSYREATRASYIANDHIVQGWIWHANLDDRVCMSCVAMHGTEHPVTETLNDHHNGRCAMIPIVPGMDKDFVVPKDGEAWFNDQPEATQQKLMGKAKFQAWKDGKLQINQLTGIRDDSVYGPMRIEPSYKDIFGKKPVRGVDYDVAPSRSIKKDLREPLIMGEYNEKLKPVLVESYNQAINEIPEIEEHFSGFDFTHNEASLGMEFDEFDKTIRINGDIVKLPLDKQDAYWEKASKEVGAIITGTDGSIIHELGHAANSTVRDVLLNISEDLNNDYFDEIDQLRKSLPSPSKYADTRRIEWTAERFLLEVTGKEPKILIGIMNKYLGMR